tara:strand:+ start:222 stop:407 length:186 start_codon:yes stop_codon:yes gene_type:complete
VKKVSLGKNKVGIKDLDAKKRLTVIVNDKTQPDGVKILGNLKKKDQVEKNILSLTRVCILL